MAGIQKVSFTSPYGAEEAEIARRQRLAEALRAQGMQPLGPTETIGGWAIRKSPMEGIGRAAQQISGAYQEKQATEMAKALRERQQSDRSADMGTLASMLRGAPATSEQIVDEQAAGGMGAPATINAPARLGGVDPAMLGQLRSPEMQNWAMQQYFEQMKPKAPIKLGKDDSLIDPTTYKPLVQAQKAPLKGGPGDQFLDPTTFKPLATIAPKQDDLTAALTAAGIDPKSPEGQRIARDRLTKMTTHAPAQSVKVDVKTGESLGKEIGPMVAESRASALGALDAINTASRIKNALSAGNVTLGPTATVRNQIDQIAQVMGVAGSNTEEKLVNTREVTRGLAQFTIAARKALKGQGQVSDFEGRLLLKAESGEIDDFTMPELKAFIATTDRLARRQYGLHKSNVDVMRKRPDLQNLVPFYEVPDLPAAEGGPQIKDRTRAFLRARGIKVE